MYCKTLSESKLNTYKQCKLKYKFRYVQRLQEPEGSNKEALEFGKYIHKVLEDGYEAKTLKELLDIVDIIGFRSRSRRSIDNPNLGSSRKSLTTHGLKALFQKFSTDSIDRYDYIEHNPWWVTNLLNGFVY